MLANLAIGDFLMGIYLIFIASVDVYYRGDYARHDAMWKGSHLCTFAGILSTLSGELSVATLVIITTDRFIAIVGNSPAVKMEMHHLKPILVALWLLVLVISLVPCLNTSYFENFYGQSEMCLAVPILSERHMDVKHILVYDHIDGNVLVSYAGKPVNTRKPNGWEYSLFIFVGINGAAFLAIIIMYAWMFKSVKKTVEKVRSTRQKKDLSTARKMILIVGTDALCWFPMVGLAIYCMLGNTLELQVGLHFHNPLLHSLLFIHFICSCSATVTIIVTI